MNKHVSIATVFKGLYASNLHAPSGNRGPPAQEAAPDVRHQWREIGTSPGLQHL